MKPKKRTDIVLSVTAVVLVVVAIALIAIAAQPAYYSVREKSVSAGSDEVQSDTVETETRKELHFDGIFTAFYPSQLGGFYPTRAIVYGELDIKQPPLCFCSERITDIELFSVADGKYENELMRCDYLEPAQTIALMVELSETPDIGISFVDKSGKAHAYSIGRNSDSTEIVLKELEK